MNSTIVTNINTIYAKIAHACSNVNRHASDVEIVAATKTRDADAIKTLILDGRIKTCGENRVQELVAKYTSEIQWDMIGRLQTNKVKYIIKFIRLIQSVDRISLLEEIERRACAINKIQKVLIEVNTGCEENKGGIVLDDVVTFANNFSKYKNVELAGLMAVAPIDASPQKLRQLFCDTNSQYIALQSKFDTVKYLSMGMSDDFEIAIECGANIIRPGRILFC
ncbi:MAG: YggS family pyridoxal phosphate-dependent enzyme [Christensenellaceae bacterium]|nr:YggS family pyridoxal phosphate-dependent enzyme [Christensenellaceae bacterium]